VAVGRLLCRGEKLSFAVMNDRFSSSRNAKRALCGSARDVNARIDLSTESLCLTRNNKMQRRSNANGQELNSDNRDASEQKQSPPLNWTRPRPRRIRISTPAQEPEKPPESEHPAPRACARAKPCLDKNINNFTKPAFFLTPRRAEKRELICCMGWGGCRCRV
jgi:hypothetical protein